MFIISPQKRIWLPATGNEKLKRNTRYSILKSINHRYFRWFDLLISTQTVTHKCFCISFSKQSRCANYLRRTRTITTYLYTCHNLIIYFCLPRMKLIEGLTACFDLRLLRVWVLIHVVITLRIALRWIAGDWLQLMSNGGLSSPSSFLSNPCIN